MFQQQSEKVRRRRKATVLNVPYCMLLPPTTLLDFTLNIEPAEQYKIQITDKLTHKSYYFLNLRLTCVWKQLLLVFYFKKKKKKKFLFRVAENKNYFRKTTLKPYSFCSYGATKYNESRLLEPKSTPS